MIDYKRVTKYQDDIKVLKDRLKHEPKQRIKELIKFKIAIIELKLKIERLTD